MKNNLETIINIQERIIKLKDQELEQVNSTTNILQSVNNYLDDQVARANDEIAKTMMANIKLKNQADGYVKMIMEIACNENFLERIKLKGFERKKSSIGRRTDSNQSKLDPGFTQKIKKNKKAITKKEMYGKAK